MRFLSKELLGVAHKSPYLRRYMERGNMEIMRPVCTLLILVGAISFITTFTPVSFWTNVQPIIWAHRITFLIMIVLGVVFGALAERNLRAENPKPGQGENIVAVLVLLSLAISVCLTLIDYPYMHRYFYLLCTLMVYFGLFYLPPFHSAGLTVIVAATVLIGLRFKGLLDSVQAVTLITYQLLLESVSITTYIARVRSGMANEATRKSARHDALTRAHNRLSFDEDAHLFVHQKLYVMISDIDNFKQYNDNYGHQTGDAILREYSDALFRAFSEGCVYRYGGDEFVCVVPDRGAAEFDSSLHAWREIIAQTHIPDVPSAPTCSAGVAHGTPATLEDFFNMVRVADLGLYQAKEGGRNQVIMHEYTPEIVHDADLSFGEEQHG